MDPEGFQNAGSGLARPVAGSGSIVGCSYPSLSRFLGCPEAAPSGGGAVSSPKTSSFDGSTGALLGSFRPFGLVSAGTLRVRAGDLDGDGRTEIVVGGTTTYWPVIRVFSADGKQLSELSSPLYNGRSLAVGDLGGDGKAENVTSPGPGYDSSVAVVFLRRADAEQFIATVARDDASLARDLRVLVRELLGGCRN